MAATKPFQYENRRGDVYYLQEGKAPSGKPKYYAARKLTGKPLDALPAGYEVYERPENAQVVVRKAGASSITEFERKQAEDAVRRASGLEHFVVAIEGDALVVYTPSATRADADELIEELAGPFRSGNSAWMDAARDRHLRDCHYVKMLRFTLTDPDKRDYSAERWCFRGSIDRWMSLHRTGPLDRLIAKLAPHLDHESFFELI